MSKVLDSQIGPSPNTTGNTYNSGIMTDDSMIRGLSSAGRLSGGFAGGQFMGGFLPSVGGGSELVPSPSSSLRKLSGSQSPGGAHPMRSSDGDTFAFQGGMIAGSAAASGSAVAELEAFLNAQRFSIEYPSVAMDIQAMLFDRQRKNVKQNFPKIRLVEEVMDYRTYC